MLVPAALLGRFAIDQQLQSRGLGKFLLADALGRVHTVAQQLGIHAVVLDALNDRARSFYVRHGFEALLDSPNHLFMTVKDLTSHIDLATK